MEIRLTVRIQDTGAVIHADGRLDRLAVVELESVIRVNNWPVTLDLTNLLSADDAGVAALHDLSGKGVRLVGVSPYIALLLQAPEDSR